MEKYVEEVSKIVEGAIEKAKELGGTAKLYAQIKAEEAKKQEQYFRMGRKYYDLFKDEPAEELQMFIDRLKASDAKIAAYKEELKKSEETAEDVVSDAEAVTVDETEPVEEAGSEE